MTVAVIRTVVITLPMLISDIVTQLLIDDVKLDIVGRFDSRELIEAELRAISPELVLVGLGPDEPGLTGLSFLAVVPAAKVIVFSSDGHSAYVSQSGASWTRLPDVGADAITSVIRSIGRDGNI
jgi:DNA-binding NarL/FixJ family response regulator